jgi:hypothetical protein
MRSFPEEVKDPGVLEVGLGGPESLAIQKKSKKGIETRKADLDKVKQRLRLAEEEHARRVAQEKKKEKDDEGET